MTTAKKKAAEGKAAVQEFSEEEQERRRQIFKEMFAERDQRPAMSHEEFRQLRDEGRL